MPETGFRKRTKGLAAALEQLIRPVNLTENAGLPYWREQILNALLLVGIIIGFFAAAAGVPHSIRKGLWAVAAIDIAVYLLIIGLFLFKRLPYTMRAGSAAAAFYAIGAIMLFSLGTFSSALVWLFVFPVAAGIFLGLRATLFAIALNILTFIVYDIYMGLELLPGQLPQGLNNLQQMLVIQGDFILLAILLNASTVYLVKKLQASLASEKTVRETLEAEVMERKHLEAALRESENKYRTYFESVSDVIYTLDAALRVTGVSPSVLKILGYTEQEIIGKPFHKLNVLDPAYLEKAFENCASVLEGEQSESVYEFIHKDGTRRFGQVSGAPLTQNGEIVGIIAVGRDITELMEAWNALEKSRERFRETVELLPSIVLEMDVEMRVTYTNSLGLETFGLTPEALDNGINALDLVHPEDKPLVQKAFEKLNATGQVDSGAIRILARHGTEAVVQLNSALMYQDKKVIGVRTCLTDITAQRKMEAELFKHKQFEALGTLAGGIAHDFNNLLTVILGNISMVKMESGLKSTAKKYLQAAEDASLHAKTLTGKILTFTKGGDPLRKCWDIETVIRDAAASTLNEHPKTACRFSMPQTLWPAHIDPDQCLTLFSNIFANAVEAVSGIGEIRVAAENRKIDSSSKLRLNAGRYLKVSVMDNGPGIPEDLSMEIFNPYFSTKQKGVQKGMGLGLTIAQSIADKHGGTIHIETGPDRGTTVNIYLPAYDEKNKIQGQNVYPMAK